MASIRAITESKSAQELLDLLIEHYRKFGSGILAKYNAFRYDGELIGVSIPMILLLILLSALSIKNKC